MSGRARPLKQAAATLAVIRATSAGLAKRNCAREKCAYCTGSVGLNGKSSKVRCSSSCFYLRELRSVSSLQNRLDSAFVQRTANVEQRVSTKAVFKFTFMLFPIHYWWAGETYQLQESHRRNVVFDRVNIFHCSAQYFGEASLYGRYLKKVSSHHNLRLLLVRAANRGCTLFLPWIEGAKKRSLTWPGRYTFANCVRQVGLNCPGTPVRMYLLQERL